MPRRFRKDFFILLVQLSVSYLSFLILHPPVCARGPPHYKTFNVSVVPSKACSSTNNSIASQNDVWDDSLRWSTAIIEHIFGDLFNPGDSSGAKRTGALHTTYVTFRYATFLFLAFRDFFNLVFSWLFFVYVAFRAFILRFAILRYINSRYVIKFYVALRYFTLHYHFSLLPSPPAASDPWRRYALTARLWNP